MMKIHFKDSIGFLQNDQYGRLTTFSLEEIRCTGVRCNENGQCNAFAGRIQLEHKGTLNESVLDTVIQQI